MFLFQLHVPVQLPCYDLIPVIDPIMINIDIINKLNTLFRR
jgi:hypothetical protein